MDFPDYWGTFGAWFSPLHIPFLLSYFGLWKFVPVPCSDALCWGFLGVSPRQSEQLLSNQPADNLCQLSSISHCSDCAAFSRLLNTGMGWAIRHRNCIFFSSPLPSPSPLIQKFIHRLKAHSYQALVLVSSLLLSSGLLFSVLDPWMSHIKGPWTGDSSPKGHSVRKTLSWSPGWPHMLVTVPGVEYFGSLFLLQCWPEAECGVGLAPCRWRLLGAAQLWLRHWALLSVSKVSHELPAGFGAFWWFLPCEKL